MVLFVFGFNGSFVNFSSSFRAVGRTLSPRPDLFFLLSGVDFWFKALVMGGPRGVRT